MAEGSSEGEQIVKTQQAYETRIEEVSKLSEAAKSEVTRKLLGMSKEFVEYKYKGYAKVSYVKRSPLRVKSVDPIEGTIVSYYKGLTKSLSSQ